MDDSPQAILSRNALDLILRGMMKKRPWTWTVALEKILRLSTLTGAARYRPENLEAWRPVIEKWAAEGGPPSHVDVRTQGGLRPGRFERYTGTVPVGWLLVEIDGAKFIQLLEW